MPHWIDEEFAKRFNGRLELGMRKETVETLRRLYDAMPSQRVGALYDFIRYIKGVANQDVPKLIKPLLGGS